MVILSEQADCSSASDFDQYDVFLSFRGPDTRTGFTNYLYRQLTGAGIQTFRDDDELVRGESLEQQLEIAIKQSSISIVVFSPNYASSTWCLNELVRILEQKNIRKVKVIPIFYKVDASDVRHQKRGSFKEAFDDHEEKGRVTLETIKEWREALTKVAGLSGFSLNNEYEDEFIDNILTEVRKSLPKLKALYVPKLLLGMNYRADQIHSWFKDSSLNNNVLIIWGSGGIGKSTIAKHFFNEYLHDFVGSSFLAWTNPMWDQNEAVGLQNQLLSDIRRKETTIYNYHAGIGKIERALRQKRVLLVLDDVSDTKQLDALLGQRQEFCTGSKILVTTRNEFLVKHFNVHYKVHEITCLHYWDSSILFSWHAFRQYHPPKEYNQLSAEILSRCEGLPLALILLGSSLYEENIEFWEKQIQKWDEMLDSNIHKAMKISYDSLEDDTVKSLFLHVACFFVGEEEDYTVKILDGCGLHATVGIKSLIQRCLLTIVDKKLMMHRVIQDMGREIVRLESPDKPGKRSRLWYHEDSFNVLKDDKGTEAVKGLVLDGQKINKAESDESSVAATDTNLLSITLGYMKNKKEEFIDRFLYSEERDLKIDTFAKMVNLELVKLNHVQFSGSCDKFPKKLRWICWHGFPQKYVPMELPLQKLIAFDLRHSLLKQVWNGSKEVKSLLFLDLSYSQHLYQTPDFRGLKQLERLILRGCSKLVIVCKTIGILQKLVLLDLRECKSLRDLPALPKSIVTLELSGCNLGQFQRTLESYDWKRILKFASPRIATGPVKLLADLPHLLVRLCLRDCNLSDECFPRDFGGLSSLEAMDLSGNLITRLPDCVGKFSNSRLRLLKINVCPQLESVIDPPGSVTEMVILDNMQLKRAKFRDYSGKMLFKIEEWVDYLEIEGYLKAVQARNVDRRVIKNLGLESLSSNFTILDNVIYESGIFSICVVGKEIPSCFTTFPVSICVEEEEEGEEEEEEEEGGGEEGEGEEGGEEEEEEEEEEAGKLEVESQKGEEENWVSIRITYTIPSSFSVVKKIQGLNICYAITLPYPQGVTFFAVKGYPFFFFDKIFEVGVYNKTKNVSWRYESLCKIRLPMPRPCPQLDPVYYVDVLWVSTWKCRDGVLEGGDILEVFFHDCDTKYGYKVKECGIRMVYEEDFEDDDGNTEDYGLLWTDEMNVSFSDYRTPGTINVPLLSRYRESFFPPNVVLGDYEYGYG